jgi:hypothetical protein
MRRHSGHSFVHSQMHTLTLEGMGDKVDDTRIFLQSQLRLSYPKLLNKIGGSWNGTPLRRAGKIWRMDVVGWKLGDIGDFFRQGTVVPVSAREELQMACWERTTCVNCLLCYSTSSPESQPPH